MYSLTPSDPIDDLLFHSYYFSENVFPFVDGLFPSCFILYGIHILPKTCLKIVTWTLAFMVSVLRKPTNLPENRSNTSKVANETHRIVLWSMKAVEDWNFISYYDTSQKSWKCIISNIIEMDDIRTSFALLTMHIWIYSHPTTENSGYLLST